MAAQDLPGRDTTVGSPLSEQGGMVPPHSASGTPAPKRPRAAPCISPRLRHLAASLGDVGCGRLEDLGLTSVVLVANCYATASLCGEDLNGEGISFAQGAKLWEESEMVCTSLIAAAVKRHPATAASLLPASSSGTHSGGVGTSTFAAASGPIGFALPDDRAARLGDDKSRVVALSLWEFIESMGTNGKMLQSAASLSPALYNDFKEMIIEQLAGRERLQLRQMQLMLRRWVRFTASIGITPWQASALHVQLWLNSLKQRGPTAAFGAFRGLRQLELHLGIPLHTESAAVKRFAQVDSAHSENQAEPLWPRMCVDFEYMAASDNVFVSGIGLAWFLLYSGTLRFRHLQRSRITVIGSYYIEGTATRGKAMKKGKQAPFKWRAPRYGITGLDLGSALAAYHNAATGGSGSARDFILFDVSPPRKPIRQASGFFDRAMTMGRFRKATAALLATAPLSTPPELITRTTTYSARRLLPSLAEFSKLEPAELLRLGGWAGDRGEDLRKLSQELAMPTRYSEQKVTSSGLIKCELIMAAKIAWDRSRKASQVVESPTWEQLLAFWPPRDSAKELVHDLLQKPPCSIADPASDSDDGDASDASGDESFSSAPDDSEQSSDVSDVDTSLVPWFLAKGKKGMLHLAGAGDVDNCTLCGRKLNQPTMGFGLAAATATGMSWSPRCKARLPADCDSDA